MIETFIAGLLFGYPVAESTSALRCYAVLANGTTLNLDSICLEPSPMPAHDGEPKNWGTQRSTTKAPAEEAGNCQYPWQTAADGSRCGDRAASERAGGK